MPIKLVTSYEIVGKLYERPDMLITATELKQNLGHYIEMSQREDILIQKNGRIVSKLSSPYASNREKVESLVGILPASFDAQAELNARRAAL